jgi:hypothetical protein
MQFSLERPGFAPALRALRAVLAWQYASALALQSITQERLYSASFFV